MASENEETAPPKVLKNQKRTIKRGVKRPLRRVSGEELGTRRCEFLRRKIKHEIAGKIADDLVRKYTEEFTHRGETVDETVEEKLREAMKKKKKGPPVQKDGVVPTPTGNEKDESGESPAGEPCV